MWNEGMPAWRGGIGIRAMPGNKAIAHVFYHPEMLGVDAEECAANANLIGASAKLYFKLAAIIEIVEAHDIESLSCDNDGERYCECLREAVAAAGRLLDEIDYGNSSAFPNSSLPETGSEKPSGISSREAGSVKWSGSCSGCRMNRWPIITATD